MPVVYALTVLLLSITLLLGLPKAVDLAQTKVSASNIPNNKIIESNNLGQVAGIEKAIIPKNIGLPAPTVSATAVLVKDLDLDFLFFVKDPDKRVPIASTTKIMTAMIALDYYKPDDILIVPKSALKEGSTMELQEGEKLSVRSLLYGLLLNSGNDAAYTLAANYPGGVPAFVQAMNSKANNLGLLNTHFENPAGFDNPNHYSSVVDLAKMASVAIENPLLSRIFATKEATVSSVDNNVIHSLKNLNKLLGMPGVIGIKTGTTPIAKENLVGLVQRDGHKILTVVLGSDDRFGETESLLDWSYKNFTVEP